MALSELAYDRKGIGEPVVLIHGVGHRRQAWGPVFEELALRYDVIALDLAGFGESTAYERSTPYTMENACLDLSANFASWGIEKPHVVGNSLGGAIGLELGARELVSSVTALSPAGFFGPWDRAQPLVLLSLLRLTAMVPNAVIAHLSRRSLGRRLIGHLLYAHPERKTAEQTYDDALALKRSTAFGRTIRAGFRYRFAEPVAVPTTVAWGTKDRILPYRQAAAAKLQLPSATHVALPGAGHVPMTDEPELIVRLIEETIGRARAARAA